MTEINLVLTYKNFQSFEKDKKLILKYTNSSEDYKYK